MPAILDYIDFSINPPVPIVFVDTLLAPRAFRDPKTGTTGFPTFGCSALIPPDHPQLQAIKDTLMKAAMLAFPDRKDPNTGQWTHVGLKFPLSQGDKDYSKGKWVLRMGKAEKSQKGALNTPPRLWTIQNGKYVPFDGPSRDAAKSVLWDGVFAMLSVQFKAYAGMGGGVTCIPNDIVSMSKGDRLQVRRDPADTFGSAADMQQYMGSGLIFGLKLTRVLPFLPHFRS